MCCDGRYLVLPTRSLPGYGQQLTVQSKNHSPKAESMRGLPFHIYSPYYLGSRHTAVVCFASSFPISHHSLPPTPSLTSLPTKSKTNSCAHFGEVDMKIITFYKSLQLVPGNDNFLLSDRKAGIVVSGEQYLITHNCSQR